MNIEHLGSAVYEGRNMMLFAAGFDPEREWFANYWLDRHGYWMGVELYNFVTAYPGMLPADIHSQDLVSAALVHDIGKLSSRYPSADIWLYPNGFLTPEKRKCHVLDGINMLREYEAASGHIIPQVVYTFTNGHHERLDGSGYTGRTGEDLGPIERMAGIFDSLMTMCEGRPYMRSHIPHSFVSAWQQLNAVRDIRYDGGILDKVYAMHARDPRIHEPGLGWVDTSSVPIFARMGFELLCLR